MPKVKSEIIILFLVLAAILLSGCGNKTDTTVQQNTQTGVNEETQSEDLKDIFSGQKVKYTADYTTTSKGNTINMRYIIDQPRFAMETKMEQGESKSIYDGSLFIACTKYQEKWQCFKMPMQNPESLETEKGINDGTIKTIYLGPCSVAGEQGSKYEMIKSNIKSTVCYTKDGILLELTTSEMSMVATKVSRTVSADAFTAPAEPTDIPNMPS